jgi:integrase
VPRKPRSKIGNRTVRLALKPQGKPYGGVNVAPGLRLYYRRNKTTAGTFLAELADGKGSETQFSVGVADDHEDADGEHILNYFQAIDRARVMARGTDTSKVATWETALSDYEANLRATGGEIGNATRVRFHTPDSLLHKPIPLLTAAELKRVRNSMLDSGLKRGTAARTLRVMKAMLTAAADHDPTRITNRSAWEIGLGGVTDTFKPIKKVLPDSDVVKLVAAAYDHDADFGLLIETLASTGARPVQAVNIRVGDLQVGREPRLMMPSSKKGRGRRAVVRRPVPITVSLATKLKAAASDRAGDEFLLLKHGRPWDLKRDRIGEPFAEIAERTGIKATPYSLRHSSIVRALIANVPTAVVARQHDTSARMLELTYAAFILDHADTVARRGLLDLDAAPPPENVVTMPRAR